MCLVIVLLSVGVRCREIDMCRASNGGSDKCGGIPPCQVTVLVGTSASSPAKWTYSPTNTGSSPWNLEHFPLMLIHNLHVARNWRTLPGKPCEEASEFCARDLVSFARPLVATVL